MGKPWKLNWVWSFSNDRGLGAPLLSALLNLVELDG